MTRTKPLLQRRQMRPKAKSMRAALFKALALFYRLQKTD